MSNSINKVTVLGNLGDDVEVRFMPDGTPVANFTVATTEKWKDKQSGEMKESTEWHRMVAYGRLAEIARDFLKKGNKAYFEGKNKTRKWTDDQQIVRYTTEVIVNDICLLGSKPAEQAASAASPQPADQNQQ